MTDRPATIDWREPAGSPADVLSQVLQLIRLHGERVYLSELRPPWRLHIPPGLSHLHFVERGQLHVELAGAPPLLVKAGDLLLLPHGRGHTLVDTGAGPPTHIIGGLFRYDALPLPPIVAALPSVVVIGGDGGPVPQWLGAMMQHLLHEATEPRPGSALMISRMLDLLVIRSLRTWAEDHPHASAALRDDRVARALRAIHEEPEHPWTLDGLAQRAAMSRSAFAEHFARVVGEPPLRYLTRWRLSLAEEMLRSGSASVAEVAHRVGYRSEAGFSRAFKAHHGYTPNAAKPPA